MAFFLEKEKTGSMPYVLIDEEKRYMKIMGESYHENIVGFFQEIGAWLDIFLETDFGHFTCDIELLYFNSSTAKILYNILSSMDESVTEDKTITVNWIASTDNEIIIESGEDFKEDMESLTFNMVLE